MKHTRLSICECDFVVLLPFNTINLGIFGSFPTEAGVTMVFLLSGFAFVSSPLVFFSTNLFSLFLQMDIISVHKRKTFFIVFFSGTMLTKPVGHTTTVMALCVYHRLEHDVYQKTLLSRVKIAHTWSIPWSCVFPISRCIFKAVLLPSRTFARRLGAIFNFWEIALGCQSNYSRTYESRFKQIFCTTWILVSHKTSLSNSSRSSEAFFQLFFQLFFRYRYV